MPRTATERARIEFLLARDGREQTRAWVARTLALYREALASASSHASISEYRPRFEAAVREFEEWLAAHG
ncbi:MAG TPA: hypothetical protein VLD36_22295 [Burkholderiales bacterium]|nr:hypothetical protein [Burkholderiales bacterium]